MKIQPIDSQTFRESVLNDAPKPVLKSRLKRIFGISSTDKANLGETTHGKEVATEFEPSSVCLAKMVQNFIEETNDKQSVAKCGRTRCNCFHGNNTYSSDDDEFLHCSDYADISDSLKSLVSCTSLSERNLLAEISKFVEKNKQLKQKSEVITLIAESIQALGYDASICKSHWEKSSFYPAGNIRNPFYNSISFFIRLFDSDRSNANAGEYEYIDAIVEKERLLIDVDFRSEFEIARPTVNYKSILQHLPCIFVGKADRLGQIVDIVSEAAKMSLKKRGMHIPPWRKSEYMSRKWLSPHTRITTTTNDVVSEKASSLGDFDLIFGEQTARFYKEAEKVSPVNISGEITKALPWHPPAVRPRIVDRRRKTIAGLGSLFQDKS